MIALITINAAIGLYLMCRALMNINQITRKTCLSVRSANLALLCGGLLSAVTPLYGMELAELGQVLIYGYVAAMMTWGKREVDHAAPRSPQ
jgi:hypothetical protein